uniref:Transcription factor HES-5 n=1 Tax=Geotrypetes seraphini TaxID=260995 RepID=A0A6P8PU80_GEOSA|nr:transcription factor HES-5-like [Geotrypetes seraphini]
MLDGVNNLKKDLEPLSYIATYNDDDDMKKSLRKPAVEKLRRDRINDSIKTLRTLLEKEVQTHQPSSKLEKADVLEMTVSYLREQRGIQHHASAFDPKSPPQDYSKGYDWCLQQTLRFLAVSKQGKVTSTKLLKHLSRSQGPRQILHDFAGHPPHQITTEHPGENSSRSFWRPW